MASDKPTVAEGLAIQRDPIASPRSRIEQAAGSIASQMPTRGRSSRSPPKTSLPSRSPSSSSPGSVDSSGTSTPGTSPRRSARTTRPRMRKQFSTGRWPFAERPHHRTTIRGESFSVSTASPPTTQEPTPPEAHKPVQARPSDRPIPTDSSMMFNGGARRALSSAGRRPGPERGRRLGRDLGADGQRDLPSPTPRHLGPAAGADRRPRRPGQPPCQVLPGGPN